MPGIRIQAGASLRLDLIWRYTGDRWGVEQADRHITGLFAAFDRIAAHGVASRPIPAEFSTAGFYFCYEHHLAYWRRLSNGDIGIVTIPHERMHQTDRFRDDFGLDRGG